MNNFWLMEEGHCMRTQVMDICSKSNNKINSELNIRFKASSIDSLIKFVQANKGRSLLPYLATIQLSDKDKKFLRHLSRPVPYRTIGLITHQYFPKQNLLKILKQEIIDKTKAFLQPK